jgi:hypothetical protein
MTNRIKEFFDKPAPTHHFGRECSECEPRCPWCGCHNDGIDCKVCGCERTRPYTFEVLSAADESELDAAFDQMLRDGLRKSNDLESLREDCDDDCR